MFVIERTLMFVFFIFFSHLLVVDRESRRDKQDGPI